jgi:transcriptional regulator with XRE-family HTH domain
MFGIITLRCRETDPTDPSDGASRRYSDGRANVKTQHADLAQRAREVREDLYGEDGAQSLADALGLPLRTWSNYERGVTIPAIIILKLIDATGVSPRWLRTGQGPKYLGRASTGDGD